jgi:hypothetical protein
MQNEKNVKSAIVKAIAFIASQQQPGGGFASFSSPQQAPFHPEHTYHTTFASALILAALCKMDGPDARAIRTKLANFLLRQKSEQWSFNYWARESQEYKAVPYPDDLDDTFCALSALWSHDASLVDGAALAHVVKLLLATESKIGGPYRTWLVPDGSAKVWQDVDIAVNANIAYFLSLAAQPLPKLTGYMERTITEQAYRSPYYPSPYPIVYYLARAYRGPKQQELASFLHTQQQENGAWGTPLHTALVVTSFVRLNEPVPEEAIQYLLSSQTADGSWNAEPFCLDPQRNGKKWDSGSSALTTAFIVETLQEYQNTRKSLSHKRPRRQKAVDPLDHQIIATATQELKLFGSDLSQTALATLRRTAASKDGQEITLLPYWFHMSLRISLALPNQLFVDLGLANLYGWMAYTIYDDFLDDEGDPRQLSVANIAMRYSLAAFQGALPGNTPFQEFVRIAFDTMDGANAWEVAHCRFAVKHGTITLDTLPAYGKLDRLAERSLGHTLTPLGVLAAMGVLPDSPQAQYLQAALRHYLIARQLNDDAHDWRADLTAGRITYVLATAIRALRLPADTLPLSELIPQVERQFWHHTLEQVCQKMEQHIKQSRLALRQSNLLTPENVIEKLLDGIESSVANTRSTITKTQQFLHTYRQ